MKLQYIVLIITAVIVYNTLYDGKLIDMLKIKEKYIRVGVYSLIGFGIFYILRKRPRLNITPGFVSSATEVIKNLPIDKHASDILTPILDFTTKQESFSKIVKVDDSQYNGSSIGNTASMTPQMKRMLNSGGNDQSVGVPLKKRSVSESKKKWVASQQQWKCKHCNNTLDHTFEVDHVVELQFGGTNEVGNLVALCRNCHGVKTSESKIFQ